MEQNNMKNKKIVVRKYYAIPVVLISPLCVSSGEDYYTDSDVLRNGTGEVFVPGTSLAGAFRNYLGVKKDTDCLMGFSKGAEGSMSSFYISDLYFHGTAKIGVRDGVMLTEEKTVENKFDMEMLETGAEGTIFFHYIVREGQKEEEFEQTVQLLLQSIQEGEIRLGANKNRGFGRLNIKEICEQKFQGGQVEEWLRFLEGQKEKERYEKKAEYKDWVVDKKEKGRHYIRIQIPLRQVGGISIRRYSAHPDQADFEHITCNGKPVIPGTSWNGAIRADVREILQELGCKHISQLLNWWFGNIEEGTAKQSQIVVAESEIQEAARLTMTRNKINRFDASTIEGALYSEVAYFNGKTSLELLVRKDENNKEKHQALLGILDLVIQDIQEGYIAVGGQTAVGRGIFEADPEREIQYSEEYSKETCMSALYAAIA